MKLELESTDLEAIRAVVRDELQGRVEHRLFSVEQAADYCGRPVQGFRKFAMKWAIPVASPDGRVLYDRQDLDCLIENWKRQAAD